MPPSLRRLSIALGLALHIAFPVGAAVSEPRWFRVEIGGQSAGFLVERASTQKDLLTTESELSIQLSRGDTALSITLESRFVETTAGEPIEMWSRQKMGQVPLEVSVSFNPEGLHQRTVQAGNVTERDLPAPEGPWLPPGAAQLLLARHLAANLETFAFRTVDPSLGPRSFELVYTRLGPPAEVELSIGRVLATPFRQQSSADGSVEATVFLDSEGRTVRSESRLLGLAMVTTLSSETECRSFHKAPELLVRSFVRPNRLLASPRSLRKAVYRVGVEGADLPPLPETSTQKISSETSGGHAAARVTVTAAGSADSGVLDTEPFLVASPYLNFRDPAIGRLLAEALRFAPDGKTSRAERLRRFVHLRLRTKDLATGFATASEVAVRLSGDCTEHAVLLAALLRGDGVPSRVVAGLLYVEEFVGSRGIFGYHMWTQAWLNGHWSDLDAMLEQPFDAAHIALTTSDLNDVEGLLTASAELVEVMGRLRIEILSTEP